MVTKQDILGYVSFTPYNTNINVLGPMLDELTGEAVEEALTKALARISTKVTIKNSSSSADTLMCATGKTGNAAIIKELGVGRTNGGERYILLKSIPSFDISFYCDTTSYTYDFSLPEGCTKKGPLDSVITVTIPNDGKDYEITVTIH